MREGSRKRKRTDLDVNGRFFANLVESDLEPVCVCAACFLRGSFKVGCYLCAVVILFWRSNGG